MCSLSCISDGFNKLAHYIDSKFEASYLFYIQVDSFISHHSKTLNSLPPSTSKALQMIFAAILIMYGHYFSFFITLFTAIPAIKLFGWTTLKDWYQKFKQLIHGTDQKLRLDQEIIEWIKDFTITEGIALYLCKSGIVRKYLCLLIEEFEPDLLWKLFRSLLVCIISIWMVFQSNMIRNVMMSVIIYNIFHDIIFSSYLFHVLFYERFQTLFRSQYMHWSKIIVESMLFIIIFVDLVAASWLCGSFSMAISISFGCYLVVRNTVGSKYQAFIYGDYKSEVIHIVAFLFFFICSLLTIK